MGPTIRHSKKVDQNKRPLQLVFLLAKVFLKDVYQGADVPISRQAVVEKLDHSGRDHSFLGGDGKVRALGIPGRNAMICVPKDSLPEHDCREEGIDKMKTAEAVHCGLDPWKPPASFH